ncbi:MAG: hypothetical protein HY046_10475 [Acidobacteria bacterium]|nr:hypothetical protein [Acidobacteriota bacterium]
MAAIFLGAWNGLAQAPRAKSDEPTFVVEYYYKAKWGFADEFLRLFEKNHLPILRQGIKNGRILNVTATAPRYHATEEGRWDYRVTITYKNVAAAHDSSGSEEIVKRLYPDQVTFQKEEQRRFEILVAHWDVPVVPVELKP